MACQLKLSMRLKLQITSLAKKINFLRASAGPAFAQGFGGQSSLCAVKVF
jgi:hypothetical protein